MIDYDTGQTCSNWSVYSTVRLTGGAVVSVCQSDSGGNEVPVQRELHTQGPVD